MQNVDIVKIHLPRISETAEAIVQKFSVESNFDLVIIGTPPFAHIQHIEFALKFSRSILCEKPCGLSSEAIRRLISAYPAAAARVGVNYQLRSDPCVQFFAQEMLGFDPEYISIIYNSSARLNKEGMPSWYLNGKLGGGVQYSVLPHIIDLVHLLGYIFLRTQVRSSYPQITKEKPFRDNALDVLVLKAILGKGINHKEVVCEITVDTCSASDTFVLIAYRRNTILSLDLIKGVTKYGKAQSFGKEVIGSAISSQHQRPWRTGFEILVRSIFDFGAVVDSNLTGCAALMDAAEVHMVVERLADG
jgi:predicted dehydrogenase